MKIQDTDALWFYYRRYYSNAFVPPHPHNLCNYFWKALGGMWLYFFWDSFFLIPLGLFGGLGLGAYYTSREINVIQLAGHGSVWLGLLGISFMFDTAAMIIVFIVWSVGRLMYLSRDERYQTCALVGGMLFYLWVLVSLMFVREGTTWTPWNLWYSFLLIGGVLGGIALLVGTMIVITSFWSTNVGKTIWEYARAVKDRNCPLMEAPESWKKAYDEKQTHATDS